MCETKNCGKDARAFGMKGSLKIRSCGDHIALLMDKKMQVFEISGFDFISTAEDGLEFEKRRAMGEKGRGNLAVLESACEKELTEAFRAIEDAKVGVIKAVESRFEEMKMAATGACSEAQTQLKQLELEFRQFSSSKENKLSALAELVCADLRITPKFIRFGISNVSDSVSAVLSSSWAIATSGLHPILKCLSATEKNDAIEAALKEAAEYAKKGIEGTLQYADSLIGDEASFDQAKESVLSELLKLEKGRIERSLEGLRYSWNVRQQYKCTDQTTAEVGQQCASLLSRQFGQYPEATQILQYCYELANATSLEPERLIRICNDVGEIYLASAQYEALDNLCERLLEIEGIENLPAEYYWAPVLYLTYSKGQQSKHREARAIVEDWRKREFSADSRLAEMLRLLACGVTANWSGKITEARKLLFQATRIGTSNYPTSPFTALAFFRLALLSADTSRELYHRQAQAIFEVSAPYSIEAANNLGNLGILHFIKERWSEAETCYQQAQTIYEVAAPRSIQAAMNLYNLANSYFFMRKWVEAEECYQMAQSIYEEAAPQSIFTANNLCNMGNLFKETERLGEAEVSYLQARAIIETAAPKSVPAANTYYNSGLLFEAIGEREQAFECFERAAFIYTENGDVKWQSQAEAKLLGLAI